MFDTDIDESFHPTFPKTAFNFHSMNTSLLEPWSRQ